MAHGRALENDQHGPGLIQVISHGGVRIRLSQACDPTRRPFVRRVILGPARDNYSAAFKIRGALFQHGIHRFPMIPRAMRKRLIGR